MIVPVVTALALALPAAAAADGPALLPPVAAIATASAAVKPPACPPYIIIGVYRPTAAAQANGCIYVSGVRGAITVTFYATADATPLRAGQAVRFQQGRGYYAFPP